MGKAIRFITLTQTTVILLSGCARNVEVYEALQTSKTTKLHTAFNIWYQNPSDISYFNIQQGKILPFGTEVEIIEVTGKQIEFKDSKTGAVYNIEYNEVKMMMPVEDYIKLLFYTKPLEELVKDIPGDTLEKLAKGIVEEGMSRREVLLAYGYPPKYRTPSTKETTWIYWEKDFVSKRVVFHGDKVIKIFKLD